MAKKRVRDSKGEVRGIYIDNLRSGTNYYVRLDVNGKDIFKNITKEFGVRNLSEAKAKQREL